MANKLAVTINPFIVYQDIMLYHEGMAKPERIANVETNLVGETLAALTANNDVDELCIYGVDAYLEQAVHDFKLYSNTLFKEQNKNVRILVNGKVSD